MAVCREAVALAVAEVLREVVGVDTTARGAETEAEADTHGVKLVEGMDSEHEFVQGLEESGRLDG